MKTLILLPLAILLFAVSCNEKENETEIAQISCGTSYGMCVGYCQHSVSLEKDQVSYTKSGWADTIVPITCSENLTDEAWLDYSSEIDLDAFFALSETIGCPDCADGGAEWVEVVKASGEKHKVTFEVGNVPAPLQPLLSKLGGQLSKIDNCEGE